MAQAVLSPNAYVRTGRVASAAELMRSEIHGMVHCSGGAQTKVLHFVEGLAHHQG